MAGVNARSADVDAAMMALAVEASRRALDGPDDVLPVGVVIAAGGRAIATGRRRRGRMEHAEMGAIEAVFGHATAYDRADGLTLYGTLEPCSMCWGALHKTPIARVVYALDDPYGGCTRIGYGAVPRHAGKAIEVVRGILAREAALVLREFLSRTAVPFWVGDAGRLLKDEVERLATTSTASVQDAGNTRGSDSPNEGLA